ncbi:MAG: hypothetical protein ABI240_16295 [Sphingomonas sp.]
MEGLTERSVGSNGQARIREEMRHPKRPGGARKGTRGVDQQRQFGEAQGRDQQQKRAVPDAIEQQQEQPHRRQNLQDIAAIDHAVEKAEDEQDRQSPGKARAEIDPAPRRAIHDDEKTQAEAQSEQRERLAGEQAEHPIMRRARGGMDPVKLEQFD